MIRGWALSEEGIEKVEVFIDGDYAFDVPYGDPRSDIGNAFPDIDGASTSGFSVPFRYSTLSAGQHTVSVVVTDEFGAQVERSSRFEVVRFDMAYINKANTPNLDWSYVSGFSDYIMVRSAHSRRSSVRLGTGLADTNPNLRNRRNYSSRLGPQPI
jgi:hypothetical protein